MARILIAIVFGLILTSLGSALYYLIRDRSSTRRTVQALTARISISVLLFAGILLAYKMGWIQATGLR